MAKSDLGGVWRTIGGRRVFIKDGQDLASAMKESGKFKFGGPTKDIRDDLEKSLELADEVIAEEEWNEIRTLRYPNNKYIKNERTGETIKLKPNETKESIREKLNKITNSKSNITDKDIKELKSQKSLKTLAGNGMAKDITNFSDDKARALREKHGRLEVVKVIHGTYGMNGALLRSYKTGEFFVITARNSNLFYWV